ncbi:hypothetical protein B0T11DRAFT_103673 [Plectosphaerella cucumerina]|uniref:Secreted protein n=1 Tax=Plectosphaerella cucumerina TaxID=40658 RepID=A0A8K0TB93_9PEZI|nr:hypothetical protein B0T11DRAFT_103673 [Plectosphaerella cucumerina]
MRCWSATSMPLTIAALLAKVQARKTARGRHPDHHDDDEVAYAGQWYSATSDGLSGSIRLPVSTHTPPVIHDTNDATTCPSLILLHRRGTGSGFAGTGWPYPVQLEGWSWVRWSCFGVASSAVHFDVRSASGTTQNRSSGVLSRLILRTGVG